jgi:hypothetical protein
MVVLSAIFRALTFGAPRSEVAAHGGVGEPVQGGVSLEVGLQIPLRVRKLRES